jgi:hypothetical protein
MWGVKTPHITQKIGFLLLCEIIKKVEAKAQPSGWMYNHNNPCLHHLMTPP